MSDSEKFSDFVSALKPAYANAILLHKCKTLNEAIETAMIEDATMNRGHEGSASINYLNKQ
jgi:hypothetical protein